MSALALCLLLSAAPAGALSWEAVQELYDRDHAEFPAHWKNEARAAPAGEWLAP